MTGSGPAAASRTHRSRIRVGALAPLSAPGWTEAGRHLLAGLELAAEEINANGGIAGQALELLVRDTAASPDKARRAVDELRGAGIVALAGEYHSVAARPAAARAVALGLPFLCSSAVLDALVDEPTNLIARLAPPQSRGWRVYADFLLRQGHRRVAVVSQASAYWSAGVEVLGPQFEAAGGAVVQFDAGTISAPVLAREVVRQGVSALLVLAGFPEPAMSLVECIRQDPRSAGLLIGAPAGQPEFARWLRVLGEKGAATPFLRYLPEKLGPGGRKVETMLRRRLRQPPSFVAFEGYDTMLVIAHGLRSGALAASGPPGPWAGVSADGSRGPIQFCRSPATGVWEWASGPIQIVERDPARPGFFRVLHQDDQGRMPEVVR